MAFIYKRINWGSLSEPVSNNKLNDMINNMDYLYEKMITGYYNMFGVTRETGLSIRVGAAKLPYSEANYLGVSHYFAKPFLPGTRPIIVSGFSTDMRWRIFMALRGFDGRAVPDHTGFVGVFTQDSDRSYGNQYMGEQWYTYIALGPNG